MFYILVDYDRLPMVQPLGFSQVWMSYCPGPGISMIPLVVFFYAPKPNFGPELTNPSLLYFPGPGILFLLL